MICTKGFGLKFKNALALFFGTHFFTFNDIQSHYLLWPSFHGLSNNSASAYPECFHDLAHLSSWPSTNHIKSEWEWHTFYGVIATMKTYITSRTSKKRRENTSLIKYRYVALRTETIAHHTVTDRCMFT